MRILNVTKTAILDCLAFSPDGSRIASSSKKANVRIWDSVSGKPLNLPGTMNSQFVGFTTGPDELIVSSWDIPAVLWDLRSNASRAISPPPDYCHDTAISPDGTRVARIEGGAVIFRTGSDGRTLWQAHYHKETSLSPCVRFDAAGSRVFVVAAHVSVLDAATGKKLHGFDLTFGKYTTLNTAALSPDGRWLATRNDDGLVVRDTADGRVVFTEPSMNYGATLAFTPDGSRIAAGEYAGNRGGVHFWHVGGWRRAESLDPGIGTVTALAFSRDGLLGAAGGFYGQVGVWDMT